jgi:uncharacterized protein YyaL (SSP411 family)
VFLTDGADTLSGDTYLDVPQMTSALRQVADAYRDRADEIRARAAAVHDARHRANGNQLQRHRDPVDHFRSLLVERFDPLNGGFGSAPKLPHSCALSFALCAPDAAGELVHMAAFTLQQMQALWDSNSGGFVQYAAAADWSQRATGKTLADNAALLHVHVDAALRLGETEYRDQAAALCRWVRDAMADETHGGFFNAASARTTDRTKYVDSNAMMAGAIIRTAALFDDVWLRDFALTSLESVIAPAYSPGDGVAHVVDTGRDNGVKGLLTDQIHAASALIWAHAATGRLPYSMLAAELLQFALRTMWDEAAGSFRDRVDTSDPFVPFELNCHAACVLDRLAVLTGDAVYQDRARAILQSLAREYFSRDLFGAAYAVAVCEVRDRRPPAGLQLTSVDWQLGGGGHGS